VPANGIDRARQKLPALDRPTHHTSERGPEFRKIGMFQREVTSEGVPGVAALERWDPFREAISLHDAVNTLFRERIIRPGSLRSQDAFATLPLNFSEKNEEFVVKASLPGIKPDDVQVTIQGDTLTIRGEWVSMDGLPRFGHLKARLPLQENPPLSESRSPEKSPAAASDGDLL
jgi:HSP20 family protein